MKTLAKLASKIKRACPLTARGFIAVFLAIWLKIGFAVPLNDLAAAVLGTSILLISGILGLLALLSFLNAKRSCKAEHFIKEEKRFSKRDIAAAISLENCRPNPLISYRVSREFTHPGVNQALHYIVGAEKTAKAKRLIHDTLRFPNRGIWQMEHLACAAEDVLGLFSFQFQLACPDRVEVRAEKVQLQPLAVPTASVQAGDELPDQDNRDGDLFDIKAYDPSDGTKRILWKAYARSRQLVVRRAEPAVAPEGQLFIYCMAARAEDAVAGALQSYSSYLEDAEVQTILGVDGLGGEHPPFSLTSSSENITKLITEAALEPGAGSGKDFAKFLGAVKERYPLARVVLVFLPEQRSAQAAKELNRELNSGLVSQLLQIAAEYGLELNFVMIPLDKKQLGTSANGINNLVVKNSKAIQISEEARRLNATTIRAQVN